MMNIQERLPAMGEEELRSLLANAIRLSGKGTVTMRKAAAELRPAIEAEINARLSTKAEGARVARAAAVEPTALRKTRRAKPKAAPSAANDENEATG